MLDHFDFMGYGAVETRKAHRSSSSDGIRKSCRRDLEVDVPPIKMMVPISGFDHLDRRVFCRGLSERGCDLFQEIHADLPWTNS